MVAQNARTVTYYGYRRICLYLNEREHYLINQKAVPRHMREMGIQAIYPHQHKKAETGQQNKSLPAKSA